MWWTIAIILGIVAAVVLAVLRARSIIYDTVIVSMTTEWYRRVLEHCPSNMRMLDIGIGTGAALVANRALLDRKNIAVTGIDYDADYVSKCEKLFQDSGLAATCSVERCSVYDYGGAEPFDMAYFSGSLMIMPDRARALSHVHSLLKPMGSIYVTQTFEENHSRLKESLKPLLKYATSIDFGTVTYRQEFIETVAAASLFVLHEAVISQNSSSSVRMFVLGSAAARKAALGSREGLGSR
eukprot:c39060_g1_i1.p1 GENE.c39060_g1_i1~~c39060_g1_i1.p1  ORF type:complete len:255 (+),score=45.61 c39060_g1_i1:50-766(+)